MVIPVPILAVHMLNACVICASYNGESQSVDTIVKETQKASDHIPWSFSKKWKVM